MRVEEGGVLLHQVAEHADPQPRERRVGGERVEGPHQNFEEPRRELEARHGAEQRHHLPCHRPLIAHAVSSRSTP